MNEIKTLEHAYTQVLLLQHVGHTTGGYKDFSSISSECLLTPLKPLLFLL